MKTLRQILVWADRNADLANKVGRNGAWNVSASFQRLAEEVCTLQSNPQMYTQPQLQRRRGTSRVGGQVQRFSDKTRNLCLYQ